MIKSKLLTEILDSGIYQTSTGTNKKIHSGISKSEVDAIIETISTNESIFETIEIGCAFGVSSLAICDALRGRENANHTIIDPFQNSHWEGIGLNNLVREGFDNFSFIEGYSEIELPKLLSENRKFDFALIDGYHTFDHTLLDFYYIERMIKPGGIIAIDDSSWLSIRKVISYILNFDNIEIDKIIFEKFDPKESAKEKLFISSIKFLYNLIPFKRKKYFFSDRIHNPYSNDIKNSSMIFLKKTHDSERHWRWFEQF
ncbi:Methyltransferase domain-containing protein [Algoriphagus faecimaris]|uniref:Methyltransferase domain-containing protein n=1 Tax=Algoriphagus faecimaris TaxID=686796 RepID=A0A1G6PTN4_9BACT|nr:class I SAM-dependent methyltransferase [Algoriphagus faecimaris]SDC83024.1 Methyltransferase domain-containing protein [Algoriphagus faecimaris]